jgi:hypothetical protein
VSQPPIQRVSVALPGDKRGRGVKLTVHLLPDAEVNAWSYTSNPIYVFMAWCLIKKHRLFHNVVLSLAQGQFHLSLNSM